MELYLLWRILCKKFSDKKFDLCNVPSHLQYWIVFFCLCKTEWIHLTGTNMFLSYNSCSKKMAICLHEKIIRVISRTISSVWKISQELIQLEFKVITGICEINNVLIMYKRDDLALTWINVSQLVCHDVSLKCALTFWIHICYRLRLEPFLIIHFLFVTINYSFLKCLLTFIVQT
jgi:hypothetical protein